MKKQLNVLVIMRGITQVRKMLVDREPTSLEYLISRCSIDTHTFVTAWREFGPTLKDVAVLTSLPVVGEDRVAYLKLPEGED